MHVSLGVHLDLQILSDVPNTISEWISQYLVAGPWFKTATRSVGQTLALPSPHICCDRSTTLNSFTTP
eukprot:746756-Hanusia_phi.AAC.11